MKIVKIKSIKKIDISDRYDLTVNATNNFFANGVLIHNSSGISSNVLVKKKLKLYEKVLTKLGVNIPDTEYGYIYSSGKPKSNLPKGILGKYVNDNGDFYSDNLSSAI